MLIGIIADLHDHLVNLKTFAAGNPGLSELWCAGDIGGPGTYAELAKLFPIPICAVAGNLEEDMGLAGYHSLTRVHPHLTFAAHEPTVFPFGPQLVELRHHPRSGQTKGQAPMPTIVISGHTHIPSLTRTDRGWRVNPGTLSGWPYPATYALLTFENEQPHFTLFTLKSLHG